MTGGVATSPAQTRTNNTRMNRPCSWHRNRCVDDDQKSSAVTQHRWPRSGGIGPMCQQTATGERPNRKKRTSQLSVTFLPSVPFIALERTRLQSKQGCWVNSTVIYVLTRCVTHWRLPVNQRTATRQRLNSIPLIHFITIIQHRLTLINKESLGSHWINPNLNPD